MRVHMSAYIRSTKLVTKLIMIQHSVAYRQCWCNNVRTYVPEYYAVYDVAIGRPNFDTFVKRSGS